MSAGFPPLALVFISLIMAVSVRILDHGTKKQSHGRLVFFFVAKKKTRQLAGKAGTNRWSGSSTADNETCATFRKHSRRQEHDNVCSKISKMCGKKEGAGKRFPKPHGFISDGAREKSRACANSSEGRAGA